MTIKDMKVIRILVLAAGFLAVVPLIAEARTVKLTCDGQRSITAAVERLKPGDTLLVEGACVENAVIPEKVVDVVVHGQGVATINGPDPTKASVTVSGRNITVQNFGSITGGREGVLVDRGGTATITNNVIHGTGNTAIRVSNAGFAAIALNILENNVGNGIAIDNHSSAYIGFLSLSDTTASPNTIQNNNNGIIILQSSSARIQGNTISGNRLNGITVSENSEARIGFRSGSAGTFSAPNVIQNNQAAGILVNRSSSARITGNTIINNTGGGVALNDGSTADIGSVGGEGGPNTITGNGGAGANARDGVTVARSSSAAVEGNIINNNTRDGVRIFRASQANVSSNTINSNGGDGIFVAENSGVNIEGANSTTSNNTGFGLRCVRGSYASGTVTTGGSGTAADSLSGNSGAKSFGATLTVMVAEGTGNSSFGPVADSDGSTFTVSPNGTVVLNSEGCVDNTN
jgi:parallel beta-helix repeat protein